MAPRTSYLSTAALAFALQLPAAAAAAQRSAPLDIVRRAVDALGGEAAARGVTNLTYDYVQVTYQLGQEETPLSPPRGTIINGRIVGDFANGRRLQEQEVRPGTATAPVLRQRRVTLRDVGLVETNAGQNPEPPAQLAGSRQALSFLPHRLLLAALDAPNALSAIPGRSYRGDTLAGVRYASGADTVALYFDRLSGVLVVVETVTDDPVLGDRRRAAIYTRWTPAGAIKFPRQHDVEINARPSEHMNVLAASTNAVLAESLFAIPDSIVARAQRPAAPAAVTVTLVELGPGVWRAEGGSHHTLVVEQPRGLLLGEAPQNRVRMSAVLDTLRSRFPQKPVELVVNTHHHWDHAGGLREVLARGVSVVTHARNVDFVRGIGRARKTVAPDALSRGAQVPNVRGVSDSLALGSADGRVVVYSLPTAHAEGVLAVYVPSVGVLFTSDVLSPGPPGPTPFPALGSRELDDFASRRGLSVRRFVGGHGRVAEWEEVTRAARVP
ncbi:MAG: MBL fold metallo-hydrolase [Gemmatimonadaceae bacterium]